jgi:hypothetical protein
MQAILDVALRLAAGVVDWILLDFFDRRLRRPLFGISQARAGVLS